MEKYCQTYITFIDNFESISFFIDIYIFSLGFLFNAFISYNTSKIGEELKRHFKDYNKKIQDLFTKTMISSLIGLILTIFALFSKNFLYLIFPFLYINLVYLVVTGIILLTKMKKIFSLPEKR